MRFGRINNDKLRRMSAFFLAGTLATCVITVARSRNIVDIDNEFTRGIYYEEDVKRNREVIMERIVRDSNDKGKVLEKSNSSVGFGTQK